MNYWQGLHGHEQIKNFLNRLLISENIPQALLFSGISGVGKDAFAFRFAESSINLTLQKQHENRISFETMVDRGLVNLIYAIPRGKNEEAEDDPLAKITAKEVESIKTEVRKKIDNPYYDMDIANANQIKINSIREIIRILSLNRDFRIQNFVIILDADLMRVEAQNSLLKVLEEPPQNTTFILTTSRTEFLAATIKSRCWMINFGVLSDSEVSSVMRENFEFDDNDFINLLPLSGGSVTHLYELVSTVDGDIREVVIEFLRQSMVARFNSGFKIMEQFIDGDSAKLILLLDLIAIWFRDLSRYRAGESNLFYKEHVATFEKFDSKFAHIQPGKLHPELEKFKNILKNTNTNYTIVAFNLLFSLADLIFNYSSAQKK